MKHLMKKAVKAAVFVALTTLALTAFASPQETFLNESDIL